MNLRNIACFLLLVSSSHLRSQNDDYLSGVKSAEQMRAQSHFCEAAREYSNAFKFLEGKATPKDRFNAACNWSLCEEFDSAYYHLFRLAEKTEFLDCHLLNSEKSFLSIRNDERWKSLQDVINPLHETYNDSLSQLLEKIHEEDQRYRSMLDELKYQGEKNKSARFALVQKMETQDSLNIQMIKQILQQHGWQSRNQVGSYASTSQWLVIQHGDLSVQEYFYPIMEQAVKDNKASQRDLAYLEDRILMRQGKKQLYGTQYKLDETSGEMRLWEIEEPHLLNERRAKVGLPPM